MKRALSAFRSLFGKSANAGDPPLDKSAFTREMARRIRLACPGVGVAVVEDLHLRLDRADVEEHNVYLDNAWQLYRTSEREGREEVMERYTRSCREVVSPVPLSMDAIVPIVKDKAWLASALGVQPGDTQKKIELAIEDLNEELSVLYALDTPSNIKYLQPEEIEALGLDAGALRSLAVGNLRQRLPRLEIQRGPELAMVVAGGDYEASLLLFDDLWEREAERIRGELVVAVPARDLLLFCDSANADAVGRLKAVVEKSIAEGSYALTSKLFVRRNRRFDVWG